MWWLEESNFYTTITTKNTSYILTLCKLDFRNLQNLLGRMSLL